MTQAPEWFCPPGHPRETQLRRQWADLARERRRGGRALPPIAPPVDVENAEVFPNIAEACEHARALRARLAERLAEQGER